MNNGVAMPWLGLGLYKTAEGAETEKAIEVAIAAGYRSFDTASMYENEKSAGRALNNCGLKRSDIFLTTKVWNTDHGFDPTLRAFSQSLKNLGMDYIDLYLIHWPVSGLFPETWNALEHLYKDGVVRAIGVSNFNRRHLDMMQKISGTVPAINQVEFHPLLFQKDLLDYCMNLGIRLEAWRPLTRGVIFDSTVIQGLSRKYGKTPAQIILRWDLQHGVVTIPKSVHPARIQENASIFDFSLSSDDVGLIDSLNQNQRMGPNPDDF